MKTCSICNVEQEDDCFYGNGKGGLVNRCKLCCKATSKDRGDSRSSVSYIYIITNPSWPNHVKIGRTSDIEKRLNTYQTYSPFRDFHLYYCRKVSNIKELEHYFEETYSDATHEWYNIDREVAKEMIEDLAHFT